MTSKPSNPTVMPREQTRRPGRYFLTRVKQGVAEPQAERIRGGCIICPGGSIWVPACGGTSEYDYEAEKSQKAPLPYPPSPPSYPQSPFLQPPSPPQHPESRPHSRQSDCSTAVESHQPCLPTESRGSLWKRWRRRIFTRTRDPNKAGE